MSSHAVSAVEKNPPVKLPNEPAITPQIVAEHGLAPDEYQRVLDDHGPHAHHGRARHLLGDVERALLLQVLARCG